MKAKKKEEEEMTSLKEESRAPSKSIKEEPRNDNDVKVKKEANEDLDVLQGISGNNATKHIGVKCEINSEEAALETGERPTKRRNFLEAAGRYVKGLLSSIDKYHEEFVVPYGGKYPGKTLKEIKCDIGWMLKACCLSEHSWITLTVKIKDPLFCIATTRYLASSSTLKTDEYKLALDLEDYLLDLLKTTQPMEEFEEGNELNLSHRIKREEIEPSIHAIPFIMTPPSIPKKFNKSATTSPRKYVAFPVTRLLKPFRLPSLPSTPSFVRLKKESR
ncbi:hypothetical protein M422DRAFT_241968 [Sphaerobolus stellatus SS14]|nr:hypothetical protein M422DRAFT_241968 [Sphaerobolus stellatus SS14]